MSMLHEEAYRSQIINRIGCLRPDTSRRWGKMSADQMLWHVNGGLSMALGHIDVTPRRPPLPHSIMRWLVLNLPWPKGAPTLPPFVPSGSYDFDAERTRCLGLIDQLAAKPLHDRWPTHPALGRMSGRAASRLQTKHLDHHLKQFGV
jgi:hypothetical protein